MKKGMTPNQGDASGPKRRAAIALISVRCVASVICVALLERVLLTAR
jgi:hypothetical protein